MIGVKPLVEVDLHEEVSRFGQIDYLAAAGDRDIQWLFDQHVFPSP